MSDTTFVAEPRSRAGKGAARAVRRQGRIPGVIYGGKQAPELITLETKAISMAYYTGKMLSRVYEVELEGKKTRVLPRDVQLDPVKDFPLHVDFMRLAAGARIALMIPVEFKNVETCPGIKRGGVLNIVRYEVELMVDADNIPDHIEADLTGFDIHDSLHISAIPLPAGATPTIERDFTVATIAVPAGFAGTGEEEEGGEAAAEGEASAEEEEKKED